MRALRHSVLRLLLALLPLAYCKEVPADYKEEAAAIISTLTEGKAKGQ